MATLNTSAKNLKYLRIGFPSSSMPPVRWPTRTVVAVPALLPDRWQRPLLASQLVVALLAQTLLITRW